MKRVVQFGAGNIGRGFLGQLYSASGWHTTYVDVDPELVQALNREQGFAIHIVGPGATTIRVENVSAVHGRDLDAVAAAVDEADLVGTSVGVNALGHIVDPLAAGLARRARRGAGVDVLICENLLHAADFLQTRLRAALDPEAHEFLARRVGLVETVVSRMIPVVEPERRAAEPLAAWVEAYNILPVDRSALRNGLPEIQGLEFIDDITAYEERKLFCHNCMHALASYFGYERGYRFIYQVMEDAALRDRVRAGAWEAGEGLVQRHGFTRDQHEAHIQDLLARFANRALADTVARCGGDPVRKLGHHDRLVGAALLALEYGVEPEVLAEGIAAAMRFAPPGDPSAPRLQDLLRREGVEHVLRELCGLRPDEPLYAMVLAAADARGLPAG